MDLPLFLSPKPNYSTAVLHLLHCINCTSLKQTNVSQSQAHIDLVYFVKPSEKHRAEGTKRTVGVLEAVFSFFQMLSGLPQEHPANVSGKNDGWLCVAKGDTDARKINL